MKIAVFGATGGTGSEIVRQALAAGHEVTAFVRSPDKMAQQHAALHVVQGDVLDEAAVAQALAGQEAVFCAIGSSDLRRDDVRWRATQSIVRAMQQQGVPRLLLVSSLGAGDSRERVPLATRAFIATVLRSAIADHTRQEEIVQQSGLAWLIARPGGLIDGPPSGTYQVTTEGSIPSGRIARADVAGFLLGQLEGEEYWGQAVALT